MSRYMRMQFRNHDGQSIWFGDGQYYINESDVYDYKWDYEVSKNDVTFTHETIDKTIPCTVVGENRVELANELYNIIDKDVREGIPGRLIIGDYWIEGYFYGHNASKYSSGKIIRLDLSFVSTSTWVREELHNFRKEPPTSDYLEYDYDYEYDYTPEVDYSHITNHDYTSSDFVMTIFGACTNPTITIAGYPYTVNVELGVGDSVEINSLNKTITLRKSNGELVNVFYARDKDHYIFQPIPSGTSEVEYEDIDFDLLLLQKRSVPKWT